MVVKVAGQIGLTPQNTQCRFKLFLTAAGKPLANSLSQDLAIGASDLRKIGHNTYDLQGPKNLFWADNQPAWM